MTTRQGDGGFRSQPIEAKTCGKGEAAQGVLARVRRYLGGPGAGGVLGKLGIWIALLVLALYLPLAGVTYAPWWYTWRIPRQERTLYVGERYALDQIHNLRRFFLHKEDLNAEWSDRERRHMSEVRVWLDRGALAALLCVGLLYLCWERRRAARVARLVLASIALLFLVFPFFQTFWRDVFHDLLFKNQDWKNPAGSISWALFPLSFFQWTVALIVGTACALTGLLAAWLARSPRSR